MKRIFLSAVVISILCSSCEKDNEAFATEVNKQTNAVYQVKSVEANGYQIYQNIMNSFVYDYQQTHQVNLLLFEQHVNQQMLNYEPAQTYKYESIDSKQLLVLKQTDASIIEKLAYTQETKLAIYAILENSFKSNELAFISNASERILVENLLALHGNGNDIWNGNKTIAFAYGAQYNLTLAILYAGAVELRR